MIITFKQIQCKNDPVAIRESIYPPGYSFCIIWSIRFFLSQVLWKILTENQIHSLFPELINAPVDQDSFQPSTESRLIPVSSDTPKALKKCFLEPVLCILPVIHHPVRKVIHGF